MDLFIAVIVCDYRSFSLIETVPIFSLLNFLLGFILGFFSLTSIGFGGVGLGDIGFGGIFLTLDRASLSVPLTYSFPIFLSFFRGF